MYSTRVHYDIGILVPEYARKSALSLAWKPASMALGGFHCVSGPSACWNGLGVSYNEDGRSG